jgi:cytochrome c
MIARVLVGLCLGFLSWSGGHAALRGHGGPVRAVAVSPDGRMAVTGSFDTSIIVWGLERDQAINVLRFHDKAVNAVAMLPDAGFATASEDGRIALWRPGLAAPERVLEGHSGPVAGLAVSPDGSWLASASWDRTIRLWPLREGTARVLAGHSDNVNAVAFTPDGRTLVSAGYDATLRFWPVDGAAPSAVTVPAPLNTLAVAPDGEIVAGAADGILRFFTPQGAARGEVEIAQAPIIAMALSPDGKRIAAAGLRGAVTMVERGARKSDATLIGPALPVWSLAFTPDGRTLLAAGSDRLVRRWNALTGEAVDGVIVSITDDLLKRHAGERGAEVFKACVACHTLSPDDGNRAGPTLHGLFGRRIGTASGYVYSPALPKLDIVWTKETVSRLFEIGPNAYTPGTKMPEQTIASEEDRKALVNFIEAMGKPQ